MNSISRRVQIGDYEAVANGTFIAADKYWSWDILLKHPSDSTVITSVTYFTPGPEPEKALDRAFDDWVSEGRLDGWDDITPSQMPKEDRNARSAP